MSSHLKKKVLDIGGDSFPLICICPLDKIRNMKSKNLTNGENNAHLCSFNQAKSIWGTIQTKEVLQPTLWLWSSVAAGLWGVKKYPLQHVKSISRLTVAKWACYESVCDIIVILILENINGNNDGVGWRNTWSVAAALNLKAICILKPADVK